MDSDVNVVAGAPAPRPRLWSPLATRNYRFLWLGETISVLGTQFHLVALPWLVLQLTDSGFTLGAVMMAAAVPRALLMLLGGSISDRISPRLTLLLSNLARAVIVGCIAGLIWANAVNVELLFVLVFLFGVADAFFYPAYMAIVPRIVEPAEIGPANSLLQSSAQVMVLLGPAVAGAVIAVMGVTLAFTFDSLSFLLAFSFLLLISAERKPAGDAPEAGLLASIGEGLRYTWKDRFISGIILITAVTNLTFTGPFEVGTALLADTKFHSAASLGIMLSASGGGALLGSLMAGVWRPARKRGLFILMFPLALSLGLAGMAVAPNLAAAAVIRTAISFTAGYMGVFCITLLHDRIAPNMLGRVMGVVTLSMFGLIPFSYLMAGLMSGLGTKTLFLTASVLVFAGGLVASTNVGLRRFE